MISSPRREQTVTVHAPPGAAPFTACLQLFRRYPLAVTPHWADGGYRSMVLMNRAAGPTDFFVLTQAHDDLFVIRPVQPSGPRTREACLTGRALVSICWHSSSGRRAASVTRTCSNAPH